jgi:hypothetical protein
VVNRGAFRIGTVSCKIDNKYLFNKRWKCTKHPQYFKDGKICFPERTTKRYFDSSSVDSFYRTFHHTNCASNGLVYGKDDGNIALAAGRLLSARFADDKKFKDALKIVPEYHLPLGAYTEDESKLHFEEYFRGNQQTWFNKDRTTLIKNYIDEQVEPDYCQAIYEALIHAYDKHDKRELRIKAVTDLIDSGELGSSTWLRTVIYKMKSDELAKPGKWPRMIGDLGVEASLKGFRVTSYIKEAMNRRPFRPYEWSEIEFVKAPTHQRLRETFKKLEDPVHGLYFVYFSDDACISFINQDGKIVRGNLDISGCDASHTKAIFEQLYEIAPDSMKYDIRCLIMQCEEAIKIRSVCDPKIYIKLKTIIASIPNLYSGSTLTTLINNLANINIGLAISEAYSRGEINTLDDCVVCAARVGYVITSENAAIMEKLQFLKYSPILDINGDRQPMLNPGVLLRATGTNKGDLPGRGNFRRRADLFQAGLLTGLYPTARFSLLDALRHHTPEHVTPDAFTLRHLPYNVPDDDGPTFRIDETSLARRYDMAPSLLQHLADLFFEAGYGCQVASPAIDRILDVDYGLRCTLA